VQTAARASREGPWPPILRRGLDVVFVGFNPSPRSFAAGHHYAHPANRFWSLLAASGLTPERLRPEDDARLLGLGYGFTDVVARATASAADLAADELRRGGACVRAQLARYRPRVAAYTGKGVYRAVACVAAGRRVSYGEQPEPVVPGVRDFVLPSPSGRSGVPWEEAKAWYARLAAAVRGPAPRQQHAAPGAT
jgi:TDG/mug DNA glycosylase family protein